MPDLPPPSGDPVDATGSNTLNKGVNLTVPRTPVDLGLEGLDKAVESVRALNTQLGLLDAGLRKFGTTSSSALNNLLKDIKKNADATNSALSGGGGGTGSGFGYGAGSGSAGSSSWFTQAINQVSQGTRLGGGLSAAGQYLSGQTSMTGGLVMGSLRFLRDRIGTTRNLSISSGMGFGMAARQQNTGVADIMNTVSRLPGGIMGGPEDLLSLFSQTPMYGASYNFGGRAGGQGVRAEGMFRGLREAQAMTPGATVQSMMSTVGGYAANTGAQQQAIMMTGGAYSMIGGGGRQKSISEWAESILKWLMGLRGKGKVDQPFTYGELMAQYFPGSNIDAWFQANGVPQSMRDYWWTYALQKASKRGTTGGVAMAIDGDDTNLAWKRLQASTELTRTEFSLGGQMTGHYLKKEQANQKFNRIFGAAQQNIIPMIADKLSFLIDRLPDTIEDLLFSLIENMAGGAFQQRPATQSGGQVWGPGKWPGGDVGDSGGYSTLGGTGLAGMSLNMKSKLGPMMQANPRLRVTSGLRDTAMQQRLKNKGYSRVSGKPSAHTRGDAADLGPASEYGWIMANAGKFGLKSGKNAGEPWHVGVGDPLNLGSILDLFGGGGGDTMGLLTQLMTAMFGGSGFGGAGTDTLDMTKLFTMFQGAGQQTPGVGYGVSMPIPGAEVSGDRLTRGIAAAKAAAAAGFSGADLISAVAIAGRESSFIPTAHRSDQPKSMLSGDRGLWQINYKNDTKLMGMGIYSDKAQLFDAATNARAAFALYQNAGNSFGAWSMGPGGWGTGSPLYNTKVEEARQIVHDAGVGDAEMSYRAMGGSTSQNRGLLQFNNTFVLGGSGGGPNGGIDVRRTVNKVADLLEDEMTKRLARTN